MTIVDHPYGRRSAVSLMNPDSQPGYDQAAVADAFETINDALARMVVGFTALKNLLILEPEGHTGGLDPKNPANKYEVGGLMKLTPRGVEVCYRLFDAGKSRYAVASLMQISFGAATHRYGAWKKLGGVNRARQPLS